MFCRRCSGLDDSTARGAHLTVEEAHSRVLLSITRKSHSVTAAECQEAEEHIVPVGQRTRTCLHDGGNRMRLQAKIKIGAQTWTQITARRCFCAVAWLWHIVNVSVCRHSPLKLKVNHLNSLFYQQKHVFSSCYLLMILQRVVSLLSSVYESHLPL